MTSVSAIFNRLRNVTAKAVKPVYSAALDFVYPPEFLFCCDEIRQSDSSFCASCLKKLKPRLSDECPRCGAPVGQFTDLSDGCGQCRRETFAFDRVIRLGVYDGDMRLACLRAKAAGGSAIARGLAFALANDKNSLLSELGVDLAVPIPEHWTRRFLHSHYAAETISREMADRLEIRWGRNVLTKLRRTPKQATSPTPARRKQQQGSFGVRRPDEVKGKTVLLIDDILTTGSTASAAARTLKQNGARRVFVAVIAVSPLRK